MALLNGCMNWDMRTQFPRLNSYAELATLIQPSGHQSLLGLLLVKDEIPVVEGFHP
jgi:hypothetical protein